MELILSGDKQIFIIDTHIMALGIRTLVGGMMKGVRVSTAVTTYAEAYDQIGKMTVLPDLVVADINLGEGADLEGIKQLVALYPSLRVLVLSMEKEQFFAIRSLKAGAIGFVSKTTKYDYLMKQIDSALQGNCVLSDSINSILAARFVGKRGASIHEDPIESLTDREMQVLEQIGSMKSTRDIAGVMKLSIKTVETYRDHLKKKLGLKNAQELMAFAISFAGHQR